MTSLQTSVGILWELASSRDSASTSPSPRNRKISPARCSPMATSRAAAFWTPFSFLAGTVAGSATTAIVLVLRHPGLDLGRDTLGLALHELIELVQRGVGHPRRQHGHRGLGGGLAGGVLLELGQRHRLLDLRQPARRAEVLALALAQAARHEEQEE